MFGYGIKIKEKKNGEIYISAQLLCHSTLDVSVCFVSVGFWGWAEKYEGVAVVTKCTNVF